MSSGKGIPDFYELYIKLLYGWDEMFLFDNGLCRTLKNTLKVVAKAIISRFIVAY